MTTSKHHDTLSVQSAMTQHIIIFKEDVHMMNNAEIIKGLDLTIEGLTAIKKALEVADATMVPTPVAEAPSKKEKAQNEAPMNPPVEENEGSATEAVVGKFDVEQLNSMKYNEFKKLSSSLGVKCTGTRDEIMERILALDVTVTKDDAVVSEPVEEDKAPAKSDKPTASKKLGKKEADEPARDEFDEQAEEIAKDTPVEDIIEALADVEIKATKKNAVQKLAEALRKGLIELDADEDEEEEDADAEETADVEEADEDGDEITAESYFAEFDPKGYNNPEEMSDERREAVEAKMDEILTAYSDESLTDDDIASYVEDNATEAEIDLLGDEYSEEDILKLYMELIKRTIDNDGEEHEQGEPYEVADKDLCCGHELKYVKKTKMYVCEHCGTEYEAE